MKSKALIIFLCVIVLGCTKKSNINVVLSTNLTNCPANYTCAYSYFDNADFKNWYQPVHGNYRVFWYKSVDSALCSATSTFYFKTPMSQGDFDITANQIASGQVFAQNFECPCCDFASITKPIGGEIKGKKTDATHWLVNATIVFGTSFDKPIDTLVVNQYFSQQKLP